MHSTTGYSPFYLEYGVEATLIHLPRHPDDTVQSVNDFIEVWQTHLHIANDALNQSALKLLDEHPLSPTQLRPGDQVMVSAVALETPESRNRPSRKLRHKKIGPFTVLRQISHQAYEIDLPPHLRAHRVLNGDHLSKVTTPLRLPQTPPPELDPATGDTVYEVESLLDHRCRGRRLEFLVKWAGFPEHDSTWETEDNLSGSPEVLQQYRNTHHI